MTSHESSSGPALNGAETIVETLVASGVEVCFANPGTSEMHFVAALDRVDGMRGVLCLFEGVATGAADGYARMAGKPACTLLHLGPGFGNGIANLHNAKKAGVPLVNIVGNHATTHLRYDAPLTSDIMGITRPVSDWLVSTPSARTAAADAARAVQAAWQPPGQVATLILPADAAWGPAERSAPPLPRLTAGTAASLAIGQCLAALRDGEPTALLLRGAVLQGEALRAAGRIAAATGARLFCDTFAPRIERGAGRVPVERLHYRGEDALRQLEPFHRLILVGGQPPVAFFAYPGKPSYLVPETCEVMTLAHAHEDGAAALQELAEALGTRTEVICSERVRGAAAFSGKLTVQALIQGVIEHLPEDAIVADEGISSTLATYASMDHAAPHDHLNLTGGAIGGMLPLATGAAIGAPGRKVVCLEGDGSGMYTLQALWTQAREKLDVLTIIFANRSYAVLNLELTRMGAASNGARARSLLDLTNPALDWTHLAQGMGVEAARVETVEAFTDVLVMALRRTGPFLIEAVL